MDEFSQKLGEVWKFIQNKPDIVQAVTSIFPVIAALCAVIWAFFKWVLPHILRLRQRPTTQKILADTFPFEVIEPNGARQEVLKRLVASQQALDDALADFNIGYVERDNGRNVSEELEATLRAKTALLILGRTGLGKTREVTEVAQRLNQEGWVILRLKTGKWLDVPMEFPEAQIGQGRKLLFFLDDLNQPLYSSRRREGVSRDGFRMKF